VSAPINPAPGWKEEDRLKAVDSYHILDTPKEEEFDDIVRMAAEACNVPYSLITLLTKDRQWFKAAIGTDLTETPLDISFCSHAILQQDLFVVPDATKDPRFSNNPLVKGDPNIRFYAGALLKSPEGFPLGTLCVIDDKPHAITDKEAASLKALARQVMGQLELRRTLSKLRRTVTAMSETEADLKVALDAKNKGEERLQLALTASGFIGTWEWDVAKDRVFASPAFVSVFGGDVSWTQEGAPVAEYIKAIHPDDVARVKASIERALTPNTPFQEEYRLVQKDGSIVWIDARGKCQFDEAGKPTFFPGAAVDITQRVLSEQAARDSARRFQFMAEAMPQKMWTATPDGGIDFFNHLWLDFTGLSFEDIRDWGWSKFIHPDDLEHTVRIYKTAVAEGKPFEMQQRFRRHDGAYRWHLARGAPMRDSAGKITMWMGSNTDIDDQKRQNDHLETLVQQRTQKLSDSVHELEAFSYSISHDMRAPLRAMIAFSDILREEYSGKLDAEGIDYLGRIGAASKRMDRLIQDVLQFSRLSGDVTSLSRIDTDKTVKEIIRSYPNLHADSVNIVIRPDLDPIMGVEAYLTQCVSNLLENGSKFVAKGTKPHIEVWSESAEGRVKLFFRDNGIGIPEHSLKRIFEIFHRVGRDNEGTGIGLAIVRKAAEKMEGTVGVSSTEGQGSLFWLDLKAA
jgi:PAS domain S-box-containing protein